ncbi:hypothetical protein Bbelb_243070 [Branchiostoma belcheri]|nr:hypothetical protein Bbelb_243070 [Branchiostoma belcheri]
MRMCGVHRLGKFSKNATKPRPIIARFTCRADREKVWKNKTRLRGKRVFISDDVPAKIRNLRKLKRALKRAKAKGKKATIVGCKLVIEGQSYLHWQIPNRWLHDGPGSEASEEEETGPKSPQSNRMRTRRGLGDPDPPRQLKSQQTDGGRKLRLHPRRG